MRELISSIHSHKQHKEALQHHIQQLESQLQENEIWQELQRAKSLMAEYDTELKEFDSKLRQAAIDEFNQTGNKKPVEGVSIVISKVLEYQPERAIRWAVANNALDMVSLKKSPFEKHARAVSDSLPLEFVTIKEEPSARISKEL